MYPWGALDVLMGVGVGDAVVVKAMDIWCVLKAVVYHT